MNKTTQTQIENIFSTDGTVQFKAYRYLMKETEKPVDWAYDVWDEIVAGLTHKDNHVRAICGQLLSNLAKSDPKNRMRKDFPKLLAVTRDERFVTARHTMQNIWKVGAVDKSRQKMLLDGLEQRFNECSAERNTTLIRYDINVTLKNLYDQVHDEKIKERVLAWNETEPDLKYRGKYAGVWRVKKE